MRINREFKLYNGLYSIKLTPTDWSQQMLDLILAKGEPTISLIGTIIVHPVTTITCGVSSGNTFTTDSFNFDTIDILKYRTIINTTKNTTGVISHNTLSTITADIDFSEGDTVTIYANTFTYATADSHDEYRYIKRDAPFVAIFDSRDFSTTGVAYLNTTEEYPAAQAMANGWADTISNRIFTEIADLTSVKDTFTREDIVTYGI